MQSAIHQVSFFMPSYTIKQLRMSRDHATSVHVYGETNPFASAEQWAQGPTLELARASRRGSRERARRLIYAPLSLQLKPASVLSTNRLNVYPEAVVQRGACDAAVAAEPSHGLNTFTPNYGARPFDALVLTAVTLRP